MKFNKINLIGWLFAFMILTMGYSCSEESLIGDIIYAEREEVEEEIDYVSSVSITPSEYTLTPGSTVLLSAEVEPVDANTDGVVTLWSILEDPSTDDSTSIISIGDDGTVTALDLGEATVQLTLTQGENTFTATSVITIVEEVIPVTALEITNKASVPSYFGLDSEFTFEYQIYPENADNQFIRWSSSDPDVVSAVQGVLSFNGGSGDVWIYAQSVEDLSIADSCLVSVIPYPVTGVVEPTAKASSIMQGESTTVSTSVLPSNASNTDLTWSITAGGDYATIKESDGVITVTSNEFGGNEDVIVTVTATSVENSTMYNSVDITVTPIKVTEISVSAPSGLDITDIPLSQYKDKTIELSVTVLPTLAGDQSVTWTSSDESIATVESETGVVTILKAGIVTITATSNDVETISGSIGLSVASDALSLSQTEMIYPLCSDIIPAVEVSGSAVNGTAVWSSSNTAVATVDPSTGNISVVGFGEAYITATVGDEAASMLLKIPGGWFREYFMFNDFDSNTDCSAEATAITSETSNYYFFPNSNNQWMNYTYDTNINETTTAAIGDETTGGYLQFYSNYGNRCNITPTTLGFERVGFNLNYPYLAIHTESQGYDSETLYTTSQSGTLKLWTCNFANGSTISQRSLNTYKSGATQYSYVYYTDLSAYLGDYDDEFDVNTLLTSSSPFFRRDPNTAVNVPLKILSVQTFATLEELQAYADSYTSYSAE